MKLFLRIILLAITSLLVIIMGGIIFINRQISKEEALSLNYTQFDQSIWEGWSIYEYSMRYEEAAELIDYYVEHKQGLSENNRVILYFHAGQLWAFSGDYPTAINEMKKARYFGDDILCSENMISDEGCWDAYVNASIAFLRKDKTTLVLLGDNLAKASTISGNPFNAEIIRRLIDHFDKSYSDAYLLSGMFP
jgi:hypothetical protein